MYKNMGGILQIVAKYNNMYYNMHGTIIISKFYNADK